MGVDAPLRRADPRADLGREPWVRRVGWASLAANIGIVCTGGAVRLTGSGLGCPTWPRCTDTSFTPHGALGPHQLIEFGNRMLTFVLVAVALATLVVVWRSTRTDLRRLAVVMALGIPLQAVIGGITVLTDLNPWVVSLHLLCSLAIVSVCVLFLWRTDRPAADLVAHTRGAARHLGSATFVAGWAVLYVGTVVTGSGPHAGDLEAKRNGLDPARISQLHADLVFLLLGLTVGLWLALRALGHHRAARAAGVLVLVELAQGVIGVVQYFTGLPELLVGLHLLGAATVAAALTWALLETREPPGTLRTT